MTRSLITRIGTHNVSLSVVETWHTRDRASGLPRMLYITHCTVEDWEADPLRCLSRALTLIHPALGTARAWDGQQ